MMMMSSYIPIRVSTIAPFIEEETEIKGVNYVSRSQWQD